MRWLFPLLVISIGTAAGAYIYSTKQPAKRKPAHASMLSVETQVLQPERFSPTIATQGIVEPRTTTTLIPRVSGEIVAVSANFRPGGFFEKGDVLLTLDSSDYQLNIKTAQAELAEARFNLEQEKSQAEQAADNWARLGRQEAPSDLVLHKPQLARAQAAVEAAQAKLQRAELDLQRTKITAPYAGRILEQFADVGQYVSPGNSLAKIFATDTVEIRLPVSETQNGMLDLPRVYAGESGSRAAGPSATVTATIGGREFNWAGWVVRTEGSVDKTTRQVFVVVQVDHPYRRINGDQPPLDIGRFVKAEIRGRALEDVFILPRSAVQGGDTVMLVDSENKLKRKKVDVLWENQDQLVVKDGLNSGDRLSVTYIPFAADNTEVKAISKTAG